MPHTHRMYEFSKYGVRLSPQEVAGDLFKLQALNEEFFKDSHVHELFACPLETIFKSKDSCGNIQYLMETLNFLKRFNTYYYQELTNFVMEAGLARQAAVAAQIDTARACRDARQRVAQEIEVLTLRKNENLETIKQSEFEIVETQKHLEELEQRFQHFLQACTDFADFKFQFNLKASLFKSNLSYIELNAFTQWIIQETQRLSDTSPIHKSLFGLMPKDTVICEIYKNGQFSLELEYNKRDVLKASEVLSGHFSEVFNYFYEQFPQYHKKNFTADGLTDYIELLKHRIVSRRQEILEIDGEIEQKKKIILDGIHKQTLLEQKFVEPKALKHLFCKKNLTNLHAIKIFLRYKSYVFRNIQKEIYKIKDRCKIESKLILSLLQKTHDFLNQALNIIDFILVKYRVERTRSRIDFDASGQGIRTVLHREKFVHPVKLGAAPVVLDVCAPC